MSEEQETPPEFVTKALGQGYPPQVGINTPQGVVPIAPGIVMQQVRVLELMIEALSRAVLAMGCSPETITEKWLEVCQETADKIDAANEAAKSKIVVAGQVPPVNGHAKRFGNYQFPKG